MTDKFTFTICINCGVEFALPTTLYERQREHGGYHHCPNGHSQGWSKEGSEFERMRRERDRLKQDQARLEQEKQEAWATVEGQRQRAEKAEAEARRIKKRAAAALCPCCNRHFADVARHMKTKHPEAAPMPAHKIASVRA